MLNYHSLSCDKVKVVRNLEVCILEGVQVKTVLYSWFCTGTGGGGVNLSLGYNKDNALDQCTAKFGL